MALLVDCSPIDMGSKPQLFVFKTVKPSLMYLLLDQWTIGQPTLNRNLQNIVIRSLGVFNSEN